MTSLFTSPPSGFAPALRSACLRALCPQRPLHPCRIKKATLACSASFCVSRLTKVKTAALVPQAAPCDGPQKTLYRTEWCFRLKQQFLFLTGSFQEKGIVNTLYFAVIPPSYSISAGELRVYMHCCQQLPLALYCYSILFSAILSVLISAILLPMFAFFTITRVVCN